MLFHLVRFGLVRLLAGPFFYANTDPSDLSIFTLCATGLLLAGALLRRDNSSRGIILGLLLVVGSVYGVIALGRANLTEITTHDLAQKAAALRYHYAASAALAALLGSLVPAAAAPSRRFSLLANGISVAVVAVMLVRSVIVPQRIDTHAAVQREVAAAVARVDRLSAGASTARPVRLENTRLSPMITGIFGPTAFPGVAALMVLSRSPAQLEDRGIKFHEPQAAVRAAFSPPHSRRLSRLLIAPAVFPGGRPPTGTLPACEFPLIQQMARGARALISCEVRAGADVARTERCRADAMGNTAAGLAPPEGGRSCRSCFRPDEEMATLAKIVAASGHVLRCLPPGAPETNGGAPLSRRCRVRAAHLLKHLDAELMGCYRRAIERTQTLDDPPCLAGAATTYLARMNQLGPACLPCQAGLMAAGVSGMVARRVEGAFCDH
jgi:hypothetical protein